jgi:hypothetical protein
MRVSLVNAGDSYMKATAVCLALVPLNGCYHHMLVINIGFANKIAASQGAPMNPQAYCLALLSPNIVFTDVPPALTTEQKHFCEAALAVPRKEK